MRKALQLPLQVQATYARLLHCPIPLLSKVASASHVIPYPPLPCVVCLGRPLSQNVDWRQQRHWSCNNNVHPSRRGTYDGISMHPYETVRAAHARVWGITVIMLCVRNLERDQGARAFVFHFAPTTVGFGHTLCFPAPPVQLSKCFCSYPVSCVQAIAFLTKLLF